MKIKSRVVTGAIAAGVLSLGMVMGTAIAANAESVGGGEWTYGTTPVSAWSHYYHGSRNHTATACNGLGICVQGSGAPGVLADGTVGKVPFSGGTSAYWNVI
jgi:lactococcin 972 family bacteriocin